MGVRAITGTPRASVSVIRTAIVEWPSAGVPAAGSANAMWARSPGARTVIATRPRTLPKPSLATSASAWSPAGSGTPT